MLVIYAVLRSLLLITGTNASNDGNTLRQPINMSHPSKIPGIVSASLPQVLTVLLFHCVT